MIIRIIISGSIIIICIIINSIKCCFILVGSIFIGIIIIIIFISIISISINYENNISRRHIIIERSFIISSRNI